MYVVFLVIPEVEEKMLVAFQKLFLFKEVLRAVPGVISGGRLIGIRIPAEAYGRLFRMLYSIPEKAVE
jgi:hypothetical protein